MVYTTEKAKDIILGHAQDYLEKQYPSAKQESGYFQIEAYTDYTDCLDEGTVEKAFEATETVVETREWLYEYMYDIYMDYISDIEAMVAKDILKHIEAVETDENLELLEEHLEFGTFFENIIDSGLFYIRVDFEEILGRSNVNLIISLEGEFSQDCEFEYSTYGDGVVDWCNMIEASLNNDEIVEEDISVLTLLKTQGYSLQDFKAYAESDEVEYNAFLSSLVHEFLNTTSSLNCLVFTKQVNLNDYLNGEVDIKTISKGSTCGYVDFINGGGSILDVRLEKDIDLTNVYHEVFLDGSRYRYGIKEIYGEFYK